MKNIRFLSENFQFLLVKFSIYLNRHVFLMTSIFVPFLKGFSQKGKHVSFVKLAEYLPSESVPLKYSLLKVV